MEDQTTAIAPLQTDECHDFTVIARYPHQMKACQEDLIGWCERKISSCQKETDELLENVKIAKKNKWRHSAMLAAANRSLARVTFYDKMKKALEMGYCIVPDFPVDIFAIRTTRKKPKQKESKWQGDVNDSARKQVQLLPAGDGDYKSSEGVICFREYETGKDGALEKWFYAKDFASLDFPFTIAKPEILSATARAMTDKVFDEIGFIPRNKKSDPMIVGRLISPKSNQYNKIVLTFLIAWWVDTKDLT